MKKIIFIIFFIFFSINITFGEESNTGSFYNEELLEIYKTPENKIIKDNRFDYIYNQAKKELSLGNEKKSYDLILEYLNRAGFYNCNVFKYLIQKEPSNNIYKDYLKSCEVLNNKWDYELAYKLIKYYIKEYDNDIINIYNIKLLGKNNKVEKARIYMKKIKNKEKLNLILNYLNFRITPFENKYYNKRILLEEDYVSKKFFLFHYIKNGYNKYIKNEVKNISELERLLLQCFKYENIDFTKKYNIKRIGVISYYQGLYSYLYRIYEQKKDYKKSLYNIYSFYNEYFIFNYNGEEKKIWYNKLLKILLNKEVLSLLYSDEINLDDIGNIISVLEKEDRNILKLYFELNYNNKKNILDINKQHEFIKLLFCNDNNFILSNSLMNKFQFNNILDINYINNFIFNKSCDIKLIKKYLQLDKDKKYLKNIFYFIILLVVIIFFFFYFKKRNNLINKSN